eukprot:2980666-Rhodomonas_salina.2
MPASQICAHRDRDMVDHSQTHNKKTCVAHAARLNSTGTAWTSTTISVVSWLSGPVIRAVRRSLNTSPLTCGTNMLGSALAGQPSRRSQTENRKSSKLAIVAQAQCIDVVRCCGSLCVVFTACLTPRTTCTATS